MRYKKVTDMEVLKKYRDLIFGFGIDYLPIRIVAREMETSKYQIQKAFRRLKEQGYMKIIKYPVFCGEYDNGLYTVPVPILTCNVYDITEKGIEKLREVE